MEKLKLRIIKDEIDLEIMAREPEKYIPHGDYCYAQLNWKDNIHHISLCPFWNQSLNHDSQNNGYCHFLKSGDWQKDLFGLLWDQVKECGVNSK